MISPENKETDLLLDQPAPAETLRAANLVRVIRRNPLLIVSAALIGLVIGAFVLWLSPPTYTATSVLLVDTRKVRALEEAYVFSGDNSGSSIDLDLASQIELLTSDSILGRVVDKLRLADAGEETEPGKSLIAQLPAMASRIVDKLRLADAGEETTSETGRSDIAQLPAMTQITPPADQPHSVPEPDNARRRVIENLKDGLSVSRIPKTLVLEISYTASDPQMAARIANEVAEAYIDDQRLEHKEAARRATTWLNEQLEELKKTIQSSEQAIQAYKAAHGLITTEGGLVQERRLTEVNRQLMAAREETAKLANRYEQIQAVLADKAGSTLTAELVADPIVADLRKRYLEILGDEQTSAKQLGDKHEAVIRLRRQKAEIEQLMRKEYERIAKTAYSELEVARSREAKLAGEFEHQATANDQSNEVQIELRELERQGEAHNSVYKDLLQKHQNALQQQSLNERSARIITSAQVPTEESGRSPLRILALSLLLGTAAGGGLGLLRELADRTFRTREQVRAELGMHLVWLLPRVTRSQSWLRSKPGAPQTDGALRSIHPIAGIMRYVLDKPRSQFSQTLEGIKIDLDQSLPDKRSKLIGVASVLSDEGSSTVTKNLASLIAGTGAKTLLIDGDLRGRELSKLLAPNARRGLVEAAPANLIAGTGAKTLSGDSGGRSLANALALVMAVQEPVAEPLQELLFEEPGSGLRFLPSVDTDAVTFTANFLTSLGMKSVLEWAKQDFAYVLVDLPPIISSLDARAIAPRLDAIILVVSWGKTPRSVPSRMLQNEAEIREKCLGVVVNKVDWKKLERFEPVDRVLN